MDSVVLAGSAREERIEEARSHSPSSPMASVKHTTRAPRENPSSTASKLPSGLDPLLHEPPAEADSVADRGSRIALTAWLLAFVILGSFAFWDLITALLFR